MHSSSSKTLPDPKSRNHNSSRDSKTLDASPKPPFKDKRLIKGTIPSPLIESRSHSRSKSVSKYGSIEKKPGKLKLPSLSKKKKHPNDERSKSQT